MLLCSLLLGFGMNAFVCIGSKEKSVAHAWVVTIGLDGTVLFWESLTGQRFGCSFSKSLLLLLVFNFYAHNFFLYDFVNTK